MTVENFKFMLYPSFKNKVLLVVGFLLFFVLIVGMPAFAQEVAGNNFLDSFIGQYADNASRWEAPLQHFARSVFWLLVLIDIVWIGKDLLLNKGDLADWGIVLLQQFLVIGFFYALLTNSSQWANALIQSFRLAGAAANTSSGGVNGIQPSDIFDAGANIATICMKSLRFDKPIDSIAMAFSALMIMVSFALIAALEVVVLIESYIFTYAGIIFLGFGGSQFTREFATRFLTGLIAVGAKLFVIQLIIGLGITLVHQWDMQIQASQALLDVGLVIRIVGGSIVFLALAKIVPETVQGMVNGASYGTGRSMVSATMAAGHVGVAAAAGAAAIGTAGLGLAAGALGANSFAGTMGATSAYLGMNAARSAGDAFGHGFDTTGHMAQYMPASFGNGQSSQGPVPFRGEEQGADPKAAEPANTIGT
jgi:type IV secretion system protein TrbL